MSALRSIRRLAAGASLLVAALGAGACKDVGEGGLPTSPPGGEETTGATGPRRIVVEIEGFAFVAPGGGSTIAVQVGDTIDFVNHDAAPHTVTSTSGAPAFDSGRMDGNATWRLVATAVGTWAFLCEFHPAMTGTLVVQASAGGGTPPTTPPGGDPGGGGDDAGGGGGSSSPTGVVTVTMGDDRFIGPDGTSVIQAAPGQTVRFVNADDRSHTATSTSGAPAFDSGTIRGGQSFDLVPTAAGTWSFRCDFHSDMTGTLVVSDGAAPPPGGNPPPSGDVTITITDAGFSNGGHAEIALGQAVEWVNASSSEHEIESTDEPGGADEFESGDLDPGERFRWVSTRTGTWVYKCSKHSDEKGMTIIVR